MFDLLHQKPHKNINEVESCLNLSHIAPFVNQSLTIKSPNSICVHSIGKLQFFFRHAEDEIKMPRAYTRVSSIMHFRHSTVISLSRRIIPLRQIPGSNRPTSRRVTRIDIFSSTKTRSFDSTTGAD